MTVRSVVPTASIPRQSFERRIVANPALLSEALYYWVCNVNITLPGNTRVRVGITLAASALVERERKQDAENEHHSAAGYCVVTLGAASCSLTSAKHTL
jgi:hypothetical protein